MAVQVKARAENNVVDVNRFVHGAGWVEKASGSLSIVNANNQELALFNRWDSVTFVD